MIVLNEIYFTKIANSTHTAGEEVVCQVLLCDRLPCIQGYGPVVGEELVM